MMAMGCRDDNDRPETITKLRALGVSQSPTIAKAGDPVSLTFYLAGPSQLTLSATPILDLGARYGQSIIVTPVDAAPTETAVGPLSIYSYKANFNIPNDAIITQKILTSGFARVRYNVKFSSTGGDEESVVGDTLVYPTGAPQLNWTTPTIAIANPAATASAGTLDLEGAIQSNGQESNKVSWFVSAGKIKNRKARITEWQEAPAGNQTLIFTVRGAKSGAFAIQSQAVNLN